MPDPLILIPAMMCDARMFAAQITDLSRGRAVMVAPLMGERVEDMASMVLASAPARFAVMGADLGGMVAMELLRRAPERVTRVALMSTSPLPESPAHAAARDPMIVSARAGRLADVMDQLVPADVFAPGPGRLAARELVQTMAADAGAEAFVRQTRALQRRRDQQPVLTKMQHPTMVICGAHDAVYPIRRHQVMAELIPHADLRIIDGAGHLPTVEQPGATTAALRDWLG